MKFMKLTIISLLAGQRFLIPEHDRTEIIHWCPLLSHEQTTIIFDRSKPK